MRISTRGRYSLEALLYLALLKEGETASTRIISEVTGVSNRYLEQLFIPLRGKKLITGVRGPLGGYSLTKGPRETTVGEVLRAVEGPMDVVECVARENCPRVNLCSSRHTWKELYQEINAIIDGVTLADLAAAYEKQDGGDYTI
jgi:Rrf2 family protein